MASVLHPEVGNDGLSAALGGKRQPKVENEMKRMTTLPEADRFAGMESRQVVAIVGIVLIGVTAALMLPLWIAAPLMLLALGAIQAIVRPEPVMEPVVIHRDERW